MKHQKIILVAAMFALALCAHFGLVEADTLGLGMAVLATTPFAVNPELTAVAVGFKNTEDSLIADELMPRVPTAETFKYTVYDTPQMYSVPDTKVGRKSEPTQVTFVGTEVQLSVDDYGLDDFVPQRDIDVFASMPKANGGPVSPEMLAAMGLSNLILLAREVRVANTVFNAANYDAALVDTLSGTDQWSDYVNSDPLADLLRGLDEPLIRPNTATFSRPVWTVIRRHPKIVQAVFNTDQGSGVVTRKQLADLLEIDRVLVGSARINTSKKGQAASYARTWGKHCSLIYTSKAAAETFQPTWGWTAQFGSKVAGTIPEPKKGLRGGQTVRVGEQVKEVVSAKAAGYFFENVIA